MQKDAPSPRNTWGEENASREQGQRPASEPEEQGGPWAYPGSRRRTSCSGMLHRTGLALTSGWGWGWNPSEKAENRGDDDKHRTTSSPKGAGERWRPQPHSLGVWLATGKLHEELWHKNGQFGQHRPSLSQGLTSWEYMSSRSNFPPFINPILHMGKLRHGELRLTSGKQQLSEWDESLLLCLPAFLLVSFKNLGLDL